MLMNPVAAVSAEFFSLLLLNEFDLNRNNCIDKRTANLTH